MTKHFRLVREQGFPTGLNLWRAEVETETGWKPVYGTSSFSEQETEELLKEKANVNA